jgi:hypothetical protein
MGGSQRAGMKGQSSIVHASRQFSIPTVPYHNEYANGYRKQGKASHHDTLECKPCPGTPMFLFTKRILLAGIEDACMGMGNLSLHFNEIFYRK